MSEQLTSLPQQYPAAAALLTEHGDKTLRAYLTQLRLRPLPDILPSEDLLTAVRDYFVPFFGTETAEAAAAILRRCRCLSTANHHHPAFEYMTVQDTILYDQWLRLHGERGDVVPFVTCDNPNLLSAEYPRGVLVYDCALPEGCLRLPLYPMRLLRACMAAVEGISPAMVENALRRLQQEVRRGALTPSVADAVERYLREIVLSDRVQQHGTLRRQTTAINAMLSQHYFTDRTPQYLWVSMETLTARLLEKDLWGEGTLLHQLLFCRRLRTVLLRRLEGVSGCWRGDTGGTHFFWGIDRRAVRFPLRLREEAGAAVLTGRNSLGEEVSVPFTPQALTEALAAENLLPGMLLCFLEIYFLRDFAVLGGYFQPTYLAQMRQGLVQALRELRLFEREAAILESKADYMTLGLIYLRRQRGAGMLPVSTAELLETPISAAEVEAALEIPVAEALAVPD